MMKKWLVLMLLLGISFVAVAFAQLTPTPSAEGARVYITNLSDGDVVTGPVLVQFGLAGMGIAPAGIQFENTGHHHLLIDIDMAEIVMDAPLPSTENIVHFGKGQTEVTLELMPGSHTLQLLLGDFSHIPHAPSLMSEQITITVK